MTTLHLPIGVISSPKAAAHIKRYHLSLSRDDSPSPIGAISSPEATVL
ncbi:MAG: hypothetical protein ACK55Z_04665 [bacterium]